MNHSVFKILLRHFMIQISASIQEQGCCLQGLFMKGVNSMHKLITWATSYRYHTSRRRRGI